VKPDRAPAEEMFPFPALTILNPDPGYARPAALRRGFLAKLFGK